MQDPGTFILIYDQQVNSFFLFALERSPEFNDFLRKALDKNVDNRWGAVQLLQVSCHTSFTTQCYLTVCNRLHHLLYNPKNTYTNI